MLSQTSLFLLGSHDRPLLLHPLLHVPTVLTAIVGAIRVKLFLIHCKLFHGYKLLIMGKNHSATPSGSVVMALQTQSLKPQIHVVATRV